MSGLLAAAGLAATRRAVLRHLNGTCAIYPMVDTAGVQTWPTIGATVRCMKGNPGRGGDAGAMYGGDAPMARFWVPVGTAVASGDRLVYGGRTYVVEMLPPQHADELLRPLDCIEVRVPGEDV
jgi:hypothetical protein